MYNDIHNSLYNVLIIINQHWYLPNARGEFPSAPPSQVPQPWGLFMNNECQKIHLQRGDSSPTPLQLPFCFQLTLKRQFGSWVGSPERIYFFFSLFQKRLCSALLAITVALQHCGTAELQLPQPQNLFNLITLIAYQRFHNLSNEAKIWNLDCLFSSFPTQQVSLDLVEK